MSDNPGNFANRPKEEVRELAAQGGRASGGGASGGDKSSSGGNTGNVCGSLVPFVLLPIH